MTAPRLAPLPDGPLIVALSGGGDSMALLHLAARAAPGRLTAITIDHGLRDVSAELALCAEAAERLDIPHEVLRWHWDGQGNLQAEARAARRALLGARARALGASVLLGHTADDQAETVIQRLGRGSGIDGLAGMSAQTRRDGISWRRPMLALSRADLRDWLRAEGLRWADDPSNEDPRFGRVRARQIMAALADLGLDQARLLRLADHAAAARDVLREAGAAYIAAHVAERHGCLSLPLAALDLEGDTERRVLAAAVQYMGRGDYRPRWSGLTGAAARARAEGQAPLAGALLIAQGEALIIARDPAACPPPAAQSWDGWQVPGAEPDQKIGPLGPALAQMRDWRAHGLPRAALAGLPGIFNGEALIGAPTLGFGPCAAQRGYNFSEFFIHH